MKAKMFLAAAAVAVTALAMTACGQAAVPDTVKIQSMENNVIQVDSREKIAVEPDVAVIQYGVYSQASDAQTCQTQNNTDLEKVIEFLKGQGVEEASIQTSNYGLNPIYDWEGGKAITGYEMETTVQVSNIPMDKVGAVLSESVEAGINSINSVSYQCSTYDEAYQQALSKAIEAAKVKAASMAAAGGCKLGGIVNIEEFAGNQIARANAYSSGAGAYAKEEMAVADMKVMPGQIDVEANISVQFAIQ